MLRRAGREAGSHDFVTTADAPHQQAGEDQPQQLEGQQSEKRGDSAAVCEYNGMKLGTLICSEA